MNNEETPPMLYGGKKIRICDDERELRDILFRNGMGQALAQRRERCFQVVAVNEVDMGVVIIAAKKMRGYLFDEPVTLDVAGPFIMQIRNEVSKMLGMEPENVLIDVNHQ